ncbi:zf-CCHC domain-containing protein [Cucumis melo var. makuwa]|uniref:Zf-CCHC domain-containing protein n=1 Tax=Cucumis melo var. makuwa TaxID=1194695 RepID=A0A5A7SIS2_CUCMM|nr:zf-CCHC domain-containing protein [Cucumis melo var. makuwa]
MLSLQEKDCGKIPHPKNASTPQETNKAIVAKKNKETEKKKEQNNKKETVEANRRTRNPYNRPFSRTCCRCGQAGHPSNSCPQRKTVAVIDADEDVNQGSYEGGRKSRIN